MQFFSSIKHIMKNSHHVTTAINVCQCDKETGKSVGCSKFPYYDIFIPTINRDLLEFLGCEMIVEN
jgi:hypothetical protein